MQPLLNAIQSAVEQRIEIVKQNKQEAIDEEIGTIGFGTENLTSEEIKEKSGQISRFINEFNMQTVQEGGDNKGTNAGEAMKINLTDASEEEMKEKFTKVAALIEDFQKGRIKADALEKFSKISALIEEFMQNQA